MHDVMPTLSVNEIANRKLGEKILKEIRSKLEHGYLWGISFRECISITFFGVLMALSKLIRIPMHVPGHSGLVWIAILTFCCLTFRKMGSGTLAGIVAGFVAVVLAIGNDGPFVFFKYFIPGLSMDLIFTLIPYVGKRWYLISMVAAFSHWTKLLCNYIIGSILNLPQAFLIFGVQVATINHLIFGFGGGILAYIIYSKTKRLSIFI